MGKISVRGISVNLNYDVQIKVEIFTLTKIHYKTNLRSMKFKSVKRNSKIFR